MIAVGSSRASCFVGKQMCVLKVKLKVLKGPEQILKMQIEFIPTKSEMKVKWLHCSIFACVKINKIYTADENR